MLEKISEARIDGYLVKAAHSLRDMTQRIGELELEIARRDRADYAEKIASSAVDRGMVEEDDAGEYAEHLASSSDDLHIVEDFVNRAAAGVPLGRPSMEKEASTGEDQDALSSFLFNNDPYAY